MSEARRPMKRSEAEWGPFMTRLQDRIRRERRRRRLRIASAALLGLALVWLLWGPPPRRPADGLLLAQVPRSDAPRFEPESGTAQALPSGALVVRAGGGS